MTAVNRSGWVKQAGEVVDPAAAAATAAGDHGFKAPRCFGKGDAHLAHAVCASGHITPCRPQVQPSPFLSAGNLLCLVQQAAQLASTQSSTACMAPADAKATA
jgi:hypothetical protein